MTKGSIKDPSIAIRPSPTLLDFIKTLNDPELELPANLLNIHVILTGDKSDRKTTTKEISIIPLTTKDREVLQDLSKNDKLNDNIQSCLEKLAVAFESDEDEESDISDLDDSTVKPTSKAEAKRERTKKRNRMLSKLTLNLNDLKWLNGVLIEKRESGGSTLYLHELLKGSRLILPKNEVIERNPVLEARCQRLRREQEDRRYQAMTKNVDSNRQHAPDDTISYQLKQINRQLIGVAQFVVSVLAGFAFGFIGIELIVGDLEFGFRLMLGIICALVIAIAEIYFLAKKLNEDLDFAERQQAILHANKIGMTIPSNKSDKKEHFE